MEKKPFWYRTSFFVFIYALSLVLVMLFQVAINLCAKMQLEVHSLVISDFLNNNLILPINAMAWLWLGIASAYIGVDRTMMFFKNIQSTNDTYNVGCPKTLRKIIFVAGLLFLIASLCNAISDVDFNLEAFASTFGSTILFYVAGQKAVATSRTLNNNIDTNGDGIDDNEQLRDNEGNIIHNSRKPKEEDVEKETETSEEIKDPEPKCDCQEKSEPEDVKSSVDEIIEIANHEPTEDEKAMERIKKVFETPESDEAKKMAMDILKVVAKDIKEDKE